jgi:hypothetical protein
MAQVSTDLDIYGSGGRSIGLTGQAFDHRVAAPLAERSELESNLLHLPRVSLEE